MLKLARPLALAALLLSAVPSANAAPPDNKSAEAKAQETKEMKEHFKAGLTHYSLGEFTEAAAEFREAYRIHAEPAILFNIAQAMRQMNDYRHAYFYYSQYLSQRPDAANREEVEQFMSAMKKKMDQDEALHAAQAAPREVASTETEKADKASATPARVAASPASPSATGSAAPTSSAPAVAVVAPEPQPRSETFWTAPHIGGVAAGGAAVALGAVALIEHAGAVSSTDTLNQRYQSGTLTTQDASLKSDVDSKGKVATVGAIGAAVLLVAGAVLVFAF